MQGWLRFEGLFEFLKQVKSIVIGMPAFGATV